MPEFACDDCGCPSITLPWKLDNDSEVRCQRCDKLLMTWRAFKARCEQEAGSLLLPRL